MMDISHLSEPEILDELQRLYRAECARADALAAENAALQAQLAELAPQPITTNPVKEDYYLITGHKEEAEIWYWEALSTETDDWEAGGRTRHYGGAWDTHLGNGDEAGRREQTAKLF